MKEKKLRKLIQKPLSFHHQDIHEEFDTIRDLLARIVINIEDIRATINEAPFPLRTKASRPSAEDGDPSGEVPGAEAASDG